MGAILTAFSAVADVDVTDALITRLTEQRDNLRAELDACQKNTRGYKIAGIATLGATAGGVYGNIKLHEKIEKTSGRGGGGRGGGMPGDTATEEQKASRECETMYCPDDRDFAIEMGCLC